MWPSVLHIRNSTNASICVANESFGFNKVGLHPLVIWWVLLSLEHCVSVCLSHTFAHTLHPHSRFIAALSLHRDNLWLDSFTSLCPSLNCSFYPLEASGGWAAWLARVCAILSVQQRAWHLWKMSKKVTCGVNEVKDSCSSYAHIAFWFPFRGGRPDSWFLS